MGLHPLEFRDCLTDSPYFRDRLHTHEKELDRTSKAIKQLTNECKDLLQAARNLSKAQRSFASTLTSFKLDCIESEQTDEEIIIGDSLKEFGRLINAVEDERDRMLDQSFAQIIQPLDAFRKESIGAAKDKKKHFDKQTAKFCTSVERYLGLKNKTAENLAEADTALEFEKKQFYKDSMQYVLTLQEVQERKKFEFVETLLRFMYGWLTFYHQGHDVAQDFKPYMTTLQINLQKCRQNYDMTREEAKSLMEKMLEVRGTKSQQGPCNKTCTREGYLYVQEKKALGTTWTKYYCLYQKENKILTMIQYNQVTGKGMTTDTVVLTSCRRRASESIDKRFCFDISVHDKTQALTMQALSEEDRRLWLDAMDGKEPIYAQPPKQPSEFGGLLDDIGFQFIRKCIAAVEERGLEDEGLYRVVGVSSKVSKLTTMGLDRRKADKINLAENGEWEVKTITSAIKNYFRSLPEPLTTFQHYSDFIRAAKQESKTLRINDIHELVHKLPEDNFTMMKLLIAHLKRITELSSKNLMSVVNLGVCFGPTLMRPQEETMAAIMDIKFCNLVVEVLISNNDKIFNTNPEFADIANMRLAPRHELSASTDPRSDTTHLMSNSYHSSAMSASAPPSSMTSSWSPAAMANNKPAGTASPPMYANVEGQAYGQFRAKIRPNAGIYSQYMPGSEMSTGSGSSSTESLNSKCSASSLASSQTSRGNNSNSSHPGGGGHVAQAVNRFSQVPPNAQRGPDSPQPINDFLARSGVASGVGAHASFSPIRKRVSNDSLSGSISSSSSLSSQSNPPRNGRRVRTLYACVAENEAELSFEPNMIIQNVRASKEPGWLEGILEGKNGLIPANYVEFLN